MVVRETSLPAEVLLHKRHEERSTQQGSETTTFDSDVDVSKERSARVFMSRTCLWTYCPYWSGVTAPKGLPQTSRRNIENNPGSSHTYVNFLIIFPIFIFKDWDWRIALKPRLNLEKYCCELCPLVCVVVAETIAVNVTERVLKLMCSCSTLKKAN